MSGALVNRSLTTVRTELEFLKDSDVITEELYNKLVDAIPLKYQKDSEPWDVDKLKFTERSNAVTKSNISQVSIPSYSTSNLSEDFSKTKLDNNPPPPVYEAPSSIPPKLEPGPVGYCTAIYDYKAQEHDDLTLSKGDKIAVIEHLSEDWWKGYKSGMNSDKSGVFPSNYVKIISEQEFNLSRSAVPPPLEERNSYNSNYGQQQQPSYGNYGAALQQQPSYGGYAQFPPPSTNYYPQQQYNEQQQQQQQPPQQNGNHEHIKKFGSKLGNAAIFGAGATIGSDIVNSIF
ncbi:unnamed protein product [Candida verbasci]|uniref:SH3 domain-containing protein n=1 Tax=Candida verbasci TaxID=1227364 RepID=A0A9W4XAP5_9ASCO|nr:unnamed protein product [Candida verbasci]